MNFDDRCLRLAAALDEASAALRSGATFGPDSWQQSYADVAPDLPALLDTLQLLERAAARWRLVPAPGDDSAGSIRYEPAPHTVGRFEILGVLGEGGMGVVYQARDPQLNRIVAIKVPKLDGRDGDKVRERFLREARATAQVRHAQVCPILEIGEQAGAPYVVMEFVEGQSLRERLATGPAYSVVEAVRLVRQVAEGLAAIHAKEIVHRDLKPGNILLDRDGQPRVTDFGLARDDNDAAAAATTTGRILGTPAYMAPEQASGESVDARADVYALGVVLYEMTTGRLPFEGGVIAVQVRKSVEKPPRPTEVRPGLDLALEAVILKALERRPTDRYADGRELADTLSAWLATRERGEPPTVDHIAPPRLGRRWVVAGLALTALAAGLGWVVTHWGDPAGHLEPVALAPGRPLVSPAALLTAVRDDLRGLDAAGRRGRRYVTLAHHFNHPRVTEAELTAARSALDELCERLRWIPGDARPRPVDVNGAVLALDLRRLGWPRTVWSQLERDYPYGVDAEGAATQELAELGREVNLLADRRLPLLRADWFARALTEPGTYAVVSAQAVRPWPGAEAARAGVAALVAGQERDVEPEDAAAELGVELAEVRRLALSPWSEGGRMTRVAWTDRTTGITPFQQTAERLGLGTPVLP